MKIPDRLWTRLLAWAMAYIARRPPDFKIGPPDDPQLERWFVIPRNRAFNIYLHRFNRSDDGRALHDHPWINCSLPLSPWGYVEETRDCPQRRTAGRLTFRLPTTPHRVVLPDGRPTLSLFFTGPVVRVWGFHCPRGWVPWQEFVAVYPRGNSTGRGCSL